MLMMYLRVLLMMIASNSSKYWWDTREYTGNRKLRPVSQQQELENSKHSLVSLQF